MGTRTIEQIYVSFLDCCVYALKKLPRKYDDTVPGIVDEVHGLILDAKESYEMIDADCDCSAKILDEMMFCITKCTEIRKALCINSEYEIMKLKEQFYDILALIEELKHIAKNRL